MKVFVDSPGLAASGARLAANQQQAAPQAAIPPGADQVSQGITPIVTARSGVLSTALAHGALLRMPGGGVAGPGVAIPAAMVPPVPDLPAA
jgi:hypothetical protein